MRLKVSNKHDQEVERGGFVFPPRFTRTIKPLGGYALSQIRACSYLRVEEVPDEGVYCPYCSSYGGPEKTMKGLTMHVKQAHPRKVKEFEVRGVR